MLRHLFSDQEWKTLKRLNHPHKIQDFLNRLPQSFSKHGAECRSPRRVLREKSAYCMEGAMLAALALRLHGQRPLLLDLLAHNADDDHVVALFQQGKYWGAISKTNHPMLRYREPIYRSVRELVMSYFHEYFLDNGKKTLRSYAVLDLSKFDKRGWMTTDDDVWYVAEALVDLPHQTLLTKSQIAGLRKADLIERKAGKLVDWKRAR